MIAKYVAKIAGTGRYLPERIVTNDDLAKIVDTSDEWIKTRTGMSQRRYASADQAASDLAIVAAENAIKAAKIRNKDIDLIIVGTVTGDHPYPSTACLVQKKLGIKNFPAFDLAAGCTGFLYAADVARQYVENGVAKNALVIGVDVLSKFTNFDDRSTCVLFGDGAGAVVISRAETTDISKYIDSMISADGGPSDLLVQPAGGSRLPASVETVSENKHTVHMEGNKVFKNAVKSMYNVCDTVLKRNHLDIKSLDWLIPHQANLRIIDSLGAKLKIDTDKVIINIDRYANTSAATVPIALDEAIKNNKIRRGDIVMMTAFGAGLTSGSMLFRY